MGIATLYPPQRATGAPAQAPAMAPTIAPGSPARPMQWPREAQAAVMSPPQEPFPDPLNPNASAVQALNDRLSAYIIECFEAAKRFRDQEITPRLQDCLERRQGRYDQQKLAEIRQLGMCETFFGITEAKSTALHAWVTDVLADRPWAIEPTPIPDLPGQVADGIAQEMAAQFAVELQQVRATAQGLAEAGRPDEANSLMGQLRDRVQSSALEMAEAVRKQIVEMAKRAAERMTERIEDQLAEGGWSNAVSAVIEYLATFPYAVLKGPYLVGKLRQRWTGSGSEAVTEPVLSWSAPNPWDIYWDPASTTIGDSHVIEISRHTAPELQIMAQSPGWIRDRVEYVIRKATLSRTSTNQPMQDQLGRAHLEFRPQHLDGPSSQIEAKNFWGYIPGEYLLDWAQFNEVPLADLGFRGVMPGRFYSVCAVCIDGFVVKCYPNPDPLGRVPYMATSFEKVPGCAVGRALPEKMRDCQDSYNATNRAMINNLAFASGPQVAYDARAMVMPINRVAPWQIYAYDGQRSYGRDPIKFNQPTIIADVCMAVAQYFSDQADDRTNIPRYIYGDDSNISGAGATASGLSMLRGDAAKGVKRLLGFLDEDIIRESISRLVAWNNAYSQDPALRGDVNIVARGALYAITRDTQQMRQMEVVQISERPRIAPLIDDLGLADVVRSIAKKADIDPDKFVKPNERILAEAQMMAMQQAAMQEQAMQQGQRQPQGPPRNSQPRQPQGRQTSRAA